MLDTATDLAPPIGRGGVTVDARHDGEFTALPPGTDSAQQFNRALLARAPLDDAAWTFAKDGERAGVHDLAQYPAMMVPRMQGILMDTARDVLGKPLRVLDPFVGSGTTLVEALRRGWAFDGVDINPLAILLCQAKSARYTVEEAQSVGQRVVARAKVDRSEVVEADFPGREKWFTTGVMFDLSRLRRAIVAESEIVYRRLLWVALAETVRTTSNSRTSTFKLHIRSEDERLRRQVNALSRFEEIFSEIVDKLRFEAGLPHWGQRTPHSEVCLRLGDIRTLEAEQRSKYDLVLSSPPYGDNATTVPYGQFSYLALQWVKLSDIEESLTRDTCLKNTHHLDSRSLGGGIRGARELAASLSTRSQAFRSFLTTLRAHGADKAVEANAVARASAFVRDLSYALQSIHGLVHPGGLSMWTVGNRRILGHSFPLDRIMPDLLANAELLSTVSRRIPSKRMAVKNSTTSTMRAETVLVFRHV